MVIQPIYNNLLIQHLIVCYYYHLEIEPVWSWGYVAVYLILQSGASHNSGSESKCKQTVQEHLNKHVFACDKLIRWLSIYIHPTYRYRLSTQLFQYRH